MKHSRQKWTGYLLFDAAFRPSFVARLRLSPRLGRIFFKKQASNQLDAQLVIAICVCIKTKSKAPTFLRLVPLAWSFFVSFKSRYVSQKSFWSVIFDWILYKIEFFLVVLVIVFCCRTKNVAKVPHVLFDYSSMICNIILAPSLKLFWKIKQSVIVWYRRYTSLVPDLPTIKKSPSESVNTL